MKTKTIKVHTAEELKKKFPDAYQDAYRKFRDSNDEIPWDGEIVDSFKAIFNHSNMRLVDYELDASNPSNSRVKFFFAGEENTEDLQGNRALAWIENNLLGDLRIKYQPYGRVDKEHHFKSTRAELSKYGKYYYPGNIKPCPFTGVCFDEDFIEALLKSIKDGDTLKDAYENLAYVASKLMESEVEYQMSEENFLEQDYEFTKDGTRI